MFYPKITQEWFLFVAGGVSKAVSVACGLHLFSISTCLKNIEIETKLLTGSSLNAELTLSLLIYVLTHFYISAFSAVSIII